METFVKPLSYCDRFLQLFDRISSTVMSPNRAPPGDAVARSRDVIELLSSTGGSKYVKDELMQLIAAPHLQVSDNLCRTTFSQNQQNQEAMILFNV